MKCFYHTDHDAVATCSEKCGKSLCQECASMFGVSLCRDCFKSICISAKSEAGANRIKAIFSIVWNAFFFVAGIALALSEINNPNANLWVILGFCWGISGLPWVVTRGILARDNSVQGQVSRALDAHVDPGTSMVTGLIGFMMKIFFGFVIGAIASPFLLAYSIYNFKKQSNSIKEMDDTLARLAQLQ